MKHTIRRPGGSEKMLSQMAFKLAKRPLFADGRLQMSFARLLSHSSLVTQQYSLGNGPAGQEVACHEDT